MPSEIFKPNEAQTSEWLHRTENSPEPYENEPELLEYTVRFSHFVCSEYPIILKKLVTFNDNDNDQFEKLDLKLTNLLPEGQPAKIVSSKLESAYWYNSKPLLPNSSHHGFLETGTHGPSDPVRSWTVVWSVDPWL